MQSGKQESILNLTQKTIITFLILFLIIIYFVFRNLFLEPTLLLKTLGESSIDPEIAFENNKATFLEFYAEWCEVCKEMAPKVSSIKQEYEDEINFVFLNVDNPNSQIYIKELNVNGIPQINLFDKKGNLEVTLIGKHEEKEIKESLDDLKTGILPKKDISTSTSSLIKENKNFYVSPRSHG